MSATQEPEYVFAPDELPTFPGSPHVPRHPLSRKIGYAGVALISAIGSQFGNNLVTVNVPSLAGSIGTYIAEASVLPAVYVGANASANLFLIKGRVQFGIPAITHTLVVLYALTAALQFAYPVLWAAVLNRAVCGLTAAALTTFTLYNMLQVFQGPARPVGLFLALSLPQLAVPLARMVPVEALAADGWHGLHLLELATAMAVLAAAYALPLPPSIRSKAFSLMDVVSASLLASGLVLLAVVLGLGRVLWWTDTPWLGWALAAAVPLLVTGLVVEHYRQKPLIITEWLMTPDILRFILIGLLVRVALAEQTYGAVGLLTAGGLTNDQLHLLFAFVALAEIAAMAVAIMVMRPERLTIMVCIAALIIALGAWLDTDATNVTRPEQLYLSQALLGFGTILFLAPSFLFAFVRMMMRGADALVSCIIAFSVTQNLGGLGGSALLGSLQVHWSRLHASSLAEHALLSDPAVVDRVRAGAGVVSGVIVDPALRTAQGTGLLGQALAREASILAFNDVFRFVTWVALLTAAILANVIIRRRIREWWAKRATT